MKGDDHHQHSSKSRPSSLPKPISMGKSRETSSKTDRKRALVALRLSMLEEGNHAISSLHRPKDEQLTPKPKPEPLAITAVQKPAALKRVGQSRKLNSRSESSAMKWAEELHATLSDEHPAFIKQMLHSHIASGFWLGLPKKFCDAYLPISDTMMVLIDEQGDRSQAKYLAAKAGLSAGWRGFSIAHKLEEDDVVVFKLVKTDTFKVYIIRRDAVGKTNNTFGSGSCGYDTISKEDGGVKDKDAVSYEEKDKIISGSPSSSEGHGCEELDWMGFLESEPLKFNEVKTFDRFSILLDGSVPIDAMFPDQLRRKYFDLCSIEGSLLHESLLKGLNCTLVVGIIKEMINISDSIRASNSGTGILRGDLLTWDRTLQSFELVGMNVGFMRGWIQRLLEFAVEDEVCLEAERERAIVGEKMRSLEGKLLEVRMQMEKVDGEIEKMEKRKKRKMMKFMQMVNAY